jgi:hypothetical protein
MRGAPAGLSGSVCRGGFSRSLVAFLGVAPCRSGESRAWVVGGGYRRRHGFGLVGRRALPFGANVSAPACLVGARVAGMPAGLAASGAMPPFKCQHRGGASTASHNKSANTDPQQQEAASPQMLWSGYLQR